MQYKSMRSLSVSFLLLMLVAVNSSLSAQTISNESMPPKGGVGKPGATVLKVVGKVEQITSDGFLLSSGWSNFVVEPFIDSRGIEHNGSDVGMPEPLFIVGPHADLVDGDSFSGLIYPAGTYTYSSVMGAVKTVRCYATTPEIAVKRKAQQK